MRKPKRLIGYLKHDEIDYPFEFDEETFSLMLFPPTIEIWSHTSSLFNLLSGWKDSSRKHEWIGVQQLHGITSERNKIIFEVSEARSNYNGFYSYSVHWYFYYSAELDPNRIDGFKILGEEINFFFPPKKVLNPEILFFENQMTVKKLSLTATNQITESCGKYRIAPHVDATIDVSAYATMNFHSLGSPMDATSILVTSFSQPVNLEVLKMAYNNLMCFLKYITYRTNIGIYTAEVFYLNHQGQKDYQGLLVFKRQNELETNKTASDQIIKYDVLKSRTGKLFTCIKQEKFSFQHLCESIDSTHHYPVSRIIMVFSAFEREFRNIYGQDFDRSPEYISAKKDVVDLIDNYLRTTQGKKRSYIKQLRKYVENRDSSFETNIKKALLDCEKIMTPFLKKRYIGSYPEMVHNLSARMGDFRNGIAHSRLDLHFEAIHLSDIKIVEELLYAIRLKKIGLQTSEIQKAISDLFLERLAL